MLNLVYNHEEGPMWRARLFHGLPTDLNPSYWSLPEIRSAFPNQYQLLFGFHHAPNDGVSVYSILNIAPRLLQDVINSTHIDNSPIGHLIDTTLTTNIEQSVREKLEEDPLKLNNMLKEMSMLNQSFKPLLSEAFSDPIVTKPKTKVLRTVLDQSIMESFKKRCKTSGISLNCGLNSVVGRAIVEMVREAGVQRDVYSITSRHAVSERRYFGGVDPFSEMGCFPGNIQNTIIDSHRGKHDFWQYAKLSDQQFQEGLKQKLTYKDRILRTLLHSKDDNFSYDSYYATQPPLLCDYFSSTLVGPHFQNNSNNKHLTSFKITANTMFYNMVNTESSNLHSFQTLFEQYAHILFYSTGLMTDEVAERLQQMTLKTLTDMSQ